MRRDGQLLGPKNWTSTLAWKNIRRRKGPRWEEAWPELRKVKFFTQTKILVQNFTPKTRNLRLICFRDKTRKSWPIQVVVGLVCYFRRPIGYLHRIWVECKCVWVKITHWNIEFRIWAKCTGVWGKIAPTILAVFIKLYPTSERVCYNQRFYPRPPKNLHRLICHICEILQLWDSGQNTEIECFCKGQEKKGKEIKFLEVTNYFVRGAAGETRRCSCWAKE